MRAFEHSPACGAFALKPAIGVALFLPNGRLELAGSCPPPRSPVRPLSNALRAFNAQWPWAPCESGLERPPRVDRSSGKPPLMMYFHRPTSGKLSDPLPCHCPAQRIANRGRPVRRIPWERKNLPSAQLNPSIAR